MSIEEHLVTCGSITFISTKRKNRPNGLKKPYEYVLSREKTKEFYEKLQRYIGNLNTETEKFQCSGITKKSLTLGIRLDLFLLGYKHGLCRTPEGVSEEHWKTACKDIQAIYFEYLGEDARIYDEPYTVNDKFQARHETYIAYE